VKCEVDVHYTGEKLCEHLENYDSYDLIFLDIELAELNGVDVGKIIRNEHKDNVTEIAYISSETKYAMELFDIQPINFLIKPLKYDDIKKVIDKVTQRKEIGTSLFNYKYKHENHSIKISDIVYLTSEKRKIHIISNESDNCYFYGTLDSCYEQLKGYNFLYIHKSYLANYRYVKFFAPDRLIMTNGDDLPISRSKQKEIKEIQFKLEGGVDDE
jgi:DNA-binding LytR/AlgR family response regulator